MKNKGAKLTIGQRSRECSLYIGEVDLIKELFITRLQVDATPLQETKVSIEVILPEVYASAAAVLLPHETLEELARMNGFALVPLTAESRGS